MQGDRDGLSPAIKMTQSLQNGELESSERGPQPPNDANARRISELQSTLALPRRQGSPTPMRLSMQTPMRISTGSRLRGRPIGDPSYLAGFGGSMDPPRAAIKSLSPVEMTTLLKKYLAEIADDHDYFVTVCQLPQLHSNG